MMEIGHDILLEIISHLDAVSIIRLLSSTKRFWNYRTKAAIIERIIPYQKYIKYEQWNKGLLEALKKDNFPQVVFFIEKGADDFQKGLNDACFKGNTKRIKYFMQLGGTNTKAAIKHAARGGHKDIVDTFLRVSSRTENSVTAALGGACQGGHIELVRYLLPMWDEEERQEKLSLTALKAVQQGNKEIVESFVDLGFHDFVEAVRRAAGGNHQELVEYFWIKSGKSSLRYTLRWPCLNGHKKMVEWLVEHGACNYNLGLESSAEGGHMDVVDFLFDKVVDDDDIKDACEAAVRGGHLEIFKKLFRDNGTKDPQLLEAAAQNGHLELVKFFIEHGYEGRESAMCKASAGDHREVIEYLIEQGANQWNDALKVAATAGHVPLVKFYLSKGATNVEEATKAAMFHGRTKVIDLFLDKGDLTLEKAIEIAKQSNLSVITHYLMQKNESLLKEEIWPTQGVAAPLK